MLHCQTHGGVLTAVLLLLASCSLAWADEASVRLPSSAGVLELAMDVMPSLEHLAPDWQQGMAEVDPLPLRHLLQASGSGNATSNCSCQGQAPMERVLQLSEFTGWMPFMRHYTSGFQRQLVAQGSRSVVNSVFQQFNSPTDISMVINQLWPDSDIAWFETVKPARPVHYIWPPPAWAVSKVGTNTSAITPGAGGTGTTITMETVTTGTPDATTATAAPAAGNTSNTSNSQSPTGSGAGTTSTTNSSSSGGGGSGSGSGGGSGSGSGGGSASNGGSGSSGGPPPANTTAPAVPMNGGIPAALVQVAFFNIFAQVDALLQVQPVMLVYRHDILKARKYAIPETWDQMLEQTEAVNGTDLNEDGRADHALCIDVDENCKHYWLFAAVAASILQSNGTASGFLVDPSTGAQLVNSSGMMRALAVWRALMAYNSPEMASAKCGMWEEMFAQGRCLFTLSYKQIYGNTKGTYAYGRTSVAPTPGSLEVWDRVNQTMVACDATRCPFSTPLQTPRTMRMTRVGPGSNIGQLTTPRVNRAPVICSIASRGQLVTTTQATAVSLDLYQKRVYLDFFNWPTIAMLGSFFIQTPDQRRIFHFSNVDLAGVNMSFFSGPDFLVGIYTLVNSLRNKTAWDPFDIEPSVEPLMLLRVAEWYLLHPAEASEYIKLMLWSVNHPNVAVDPQRAAQLRLAVAHAATQAIQNVDWAFIKSGLDYKMGPSMWGSVPSAWWTLSQYQTDIGYQNSSAGGSRWEGKSYQMDTGGHKWTAGELTAVIVVPIGVTVFALLGLAMYMKRSLSGYDMFGNVRPPGVGAGTCLVVTDIQNSTHLWECLPHLVMDKAVRIHHEVLRGLLSKYKGYESCTEGDSFLLAFHTPGDALSYCLSAQAALNEAAWPDQLLNDPSSAEDAATVHLAYVAANFAWFDRNCAVPDASWGQRRKPRTQSRTSAFFKRLSSSLWKSSGNNTSNTNARSSTFPRSSFEAPSVRATPSGDGTYKANVSGTLSLVSEAFVEEEARTCMEPASPHGMIRTKDDSNDNSGSLDLVPAEALVDPAQQCGIPLKQWLQHEVHHVADPFVWQNTVSDLASQQHLVTVFKGLRVRMGIHSGLVNPQEWRLNKTTSRMTATGSFLSTAKAIGDVGAGGMITLSAAAMESLSHFGLPTNLVILHLGEHQLKDQDGSHAVYCALPSALISRLAVFPDLRSLQISSPGVLTAPCQCATVVFMHAVGVKSLLSWNEQLAKDALHLYHEAVSRSLLEWDGYLVEMSDGFCLAAFCEAGDAIGWALSCQADLLAQDWDPRLLRHELCEEVTVMVQTQMQSHLAPGNHLPGSILARRASQTPSLPDMPQRVHRRSCALPSPGLDALLDSHAAMESVGPPPEDNRLSVNMPSVTLYVAESTTGAGLAAHEMSENLEKAFLSGDHADGGSHRPSMQNGGPGARHPRGLERRRSCVQVQRRTILRGLRIKAGMAMGTVNTQVSPLSGRMEFRGKVMNRAARISALAHTAQVLCSGAVWNAGVGSPRLQQMSVMGSSLGFQTMKGISGKVEIIHATLGDPAMQPPAGFVAMHGQDALEPAAAPPSLAA